ncbi:MAG: hypothetical protein ACJ76L_14985 [Conexibacter sp.]
MSVVDEADPVAALVHLAYECGHVIGRARARSLYNRFGYAKAREHVVLPARLVDLAATELRRELSFDAASRLLAEARGDFTAACRLMPSRTATSAVGRPRITPSELRAFADEHGIRLGASSAQRYASDPTRDPRERVRSLGRIRDAGSRHGIRVDVRRAAARLAGADDDEDVALGRIEHRAHRRQLLNARLCRVTNRTGSSTHRIDVAAWCGCSGCYQQLGELLSAYARGIARRRHCRVDADLEQIACEALLHALLDWQGRSGFKQYYGGVLAHRLDGDLRRALSEARGSGDRPLSLDAPRMGRSERGGTWVDRIPGHSVNPIDIVLLRERELERRRSRRREIERVLLLYETMKRFA